MFKPLVAATAVLAIAGSSIVYAQQPFGGLGGYGQGGPRFEQHYRPSIDDIKAFTDARIAALKAGLELTPDQEKNWPPFEQALRDLVKLHVARVQAREAAGEQQEQQPPPPPTGPFARLQRRADAMSQLAATLKHVADTGAPLYQSLSDAQKHRFCILAHMLRPHWMGGGGFWQEHHGHGMIGPGHDNGGPHGMMSPDRDNGGPHGMMSPDRDNGGPHGMMSPGQDNGGPHGMMSPGQDNGGPHGMMGPERDQDSDNL